MLVPVDDIETLEVSYEDLREAVELEHKSTPVETAITVTPPFEEVTTTELEYCDDGMWYLQREDVDPHAFRLKPRALFGGYLPDIEFVNPADAIHQLIEDGHDPTIDEKEAIRAECKQENRERLEEEVADEVNLNYHFDLDRDVLVKLRLTV